LRDAIALLRQFIYNIHTSVAASTNMSDQQAPRTERSDAAPETHLSGLLWEARADTGELTLLGGEAHSLLGSYADLAPGKPRLSIDMFHPSDRELVATMVARLLSTGEPAVFDARIVGAGPEPIWVRSAIRTVEHETGPHLRGVSFDVSDLKRAQTEFIRARGRLSFLAGVSRMLAESLDYEKTLENVARSAVPEIADWCAVRIIATDGSMERLADVHSDPSRHTMLREMDEKFPPTEDFGPRKVIREGKSEFLPDSSGLADLVGTNAKHRDLLRRIGFTSYICVPMRGRENVLGIISMAITDSGRKFTEADLELAEVLAARASMAIENARLYRNVRDELQRRETFIAQLGHELRNPLSAIANAVAVLDTARPDADSAILLRDILKRQTSQLSRLVNDLLDVSRITQGKILLNSKPLDLGELVARCVQTLKATGGENGRRIDLRIAPGDLTIDGDEVRVEQIIWNLLTNAIKFTEADGRIDVAVARENTVALFTVSDDGAGISAEELPNIFRPFHQATIGSVEAGGMGLGLALVEQMTRLHGGEVAVSSAGPRAGSRFEVRLPLAKLTSRSQPAEAATREPVRKKRILIVDDNADALESMKMLLEYVGHEIEAASDGTTALGRALAWRPEVALIDIGLPDINGYELVTRLRALSLVPRPLLVALTGYGQPEDRKRALAAGFDIHLIKPVNLEELIQILNTQSLPES
jgi:signal transduction histidine kinase/ActR/RegA family two-component response regulator